MPEQLKALPFEEIQGQPRAISFLERVLETGRLAHAYLFVGPEGVGRETIALSFFMRLVCAEGRGCGKCLPCRKLLKGLHPDVEILSPSGKNIRIEQIRELEAKLHFRPLEGERRLVLLPKAEALSREAANALLKSLEEPPPYALFILITQSTEALLPTIVSRCQVLRLRPLPREVIKRLLTERFGKLPEEAEGLSFLAEGSIGRALFLSEKGLLEELFRFAKVLSEGSPSQLVSFAETIPALKDDQPLFWELVLLWLRRALISYLGLSPYPAVLPPRPPEGFILYAMRRIARVFSALEANLNQELWTISLLNDLTARWQAEVAAEGARAA